MPHILLSYLVSVCIWGFDLHHKERPEDTQSQLDAFVFQVVGGQSQSLEVIGGLQQVARDVLVKI